MPLQIPNLDDRGYADLVDEARRLIVTYDPLWTNHNPSDPGITLIELFAYLTEISFYRLNRVTEANQRKFLQLLAPDAATSPDLAADTRAAVRRVREQFRAVTTADFERLAVEDFNQLLTRMQQAEALGQSIDEWWRVTGADPGDAASLPSQLPAIARARCLSSINLDRGVGVERASPASPDLGHVSLVIVPATPGVPQPSQPTCDALFGFLDERRTLTTRHHVVGPTVAPVSAEIVIARTSDALEPNVKQRVVDKLQAFLDPLVGGASQTGWPFGRDVFVSELEAQLEGVSGVDYVADLMLFSGCLQPDQRCVAGAPIFHAEGNLVGLALAGHHLPLSRIDPAQIVVVPSGSIITAGVTATLTDVKDDLATIKRQIKSVVRSFFHPLHGGPQPGAAADSALTLAALAGALSLAAVHAGIALALDVDPAHRLLDGASVVGLLVRAGEVVDPRVVIVDAQGQPGAAP